MIAAKEKMPDESTSTSSDPTGQNADDLSNALDPGQERADSKPFIVGIGASAGGLNAFKNFLSAVPVDSDAAFVLIPHLDPSHESLMVELLARHTAMPVVEASEGLAIKPNHVYVIPPNKYMTVASGVLHLTGPVERGGPQTSIDIFLRSLADDAQEKAICIILSGTGTHGTLGLNAIKAAGGVTIVQDPATSEYPSMPRSAIDNGMVDYVLPVEQMPGAIVSYIQRFRCTDQDAHASGGPADDAGWFCDSWGIPGFSKGSSRGGPATHQGHANQRD